MLLSIDRVLQLLIDGKSIDKIAEMANCEAKDVVRILEEAKGILAKYEKPHSRKKIILKKNRDPETASPDKNGSDQEQRSILIGAEFTTIPIRSTLTMYISGANKDMGAASKKKKTSSGIGIVIHDSDGHQVGKVSAYIGRTTELVARYNALIRALKIAKYFETQDLRIRLDSEHMMKQLNGEIEVTDHVLDRLIRDAKDLCKEIKSYRFELVSTITNEKAEHLARQAVHNISSRPR